MSTGQIISLLITVTLIEMMFAIGLNVRLDEIVPVTSDRRLLLRASLANDVAVPVVAVLLVFLASPEPMAAAGFLILAVCSGAPYGPPLTAVARGTNAISVGLMVSLAVSSVVVAPLLLYLLLPLTTGAANLHVNPLGVLWIILATQLIPLGCGLALAHSKPRLAAHLLGPSVAISKILNAITFAIILGAQFRLFIDVRPIGILGMLVLLIVSLGVGWLAGRDGEEDRRAVALTTSTRNVGVGVAIAANTFPETTAIAAVLSWSTGSFSSLGHF
ncbi:bile acid:sodium symporter family protein [Microvirga puerhi]|uniref:Bile acid:sodium symporter family protein n=1 Tax=Microvirga puerhi TaxID=2876078 RepID=A0ABS7VLU4_9HYPH|nr:hypothetical protein [Microvirga puerhi]MBZ6075923.1 hypothetical protein [Microvirga puerhi]